MNAGRHSADDGSFGRSAGSAAARGTALIVVAVLIGFFLLRATDDTTPVAASDGSPAVTTTTTPEDSPTTLPPRPPAEVRVLVANGSDVSGAAKKTSDALRAAGYNVLAATDTKEPATAPAVYFTPGFEAEAAVIAEALGVGPASVAALPDPAPVDDLRGANVLVVLDRGLATAAPAASSPTTAAP